MEISGHKTPGVFLRYRIVNDKDKAEALMRTSSANRKSNVVSMQRRDKEARGK